MTEQSIGDSAQREWIEEFEAAARRTLETRDSMAEYREWCEAHLPAWLGYGRV